MTGTLLWITQATIVLGAGLVAALCWRRRASAAHAVLLLALASALAIPAASWFASRAGWGYLPPRPARLTGTLQTAPPRLDRDVASSAVPPVHTASAVGAPVTTPGPAFEPGRTTSRLTSPLLLRLGAAAWIAMSVAALVRLGLGAWMARSILSRSRPVESPELQSALRTAARQLGVRTAVALRTGPRAACPMIWCWGPPRIIVPDRPAPAGVDWAAVMAHELAHLQRRDHLSALVAELVVCALPWHPLAWIARRRLAALAERACDDWAVRCASSAEAYAESLVAFAPTPGAAILAPAIARKRGLGARIVRILAGRAGEPRVARSLVLLAPAVAIAGVALIALARPRDAQPAEKPVIQPGDPRAQVDAFLDYWRQTAAKPRREDLWDHARALAKSGDKRAIPAMIGVIDADNSYDTIYGVGYFGLTPLTGVKYSPYHDGAWWGRWWDANKASLPEEVRAATIPDLPKSPAAANHTPFPESLDTFDGKLEWLLKSFNEGKLGGLGLSEIAGQLAEYKDPRTIPVMIGIIDADNSYDTVYGVGYFGLGKLTGVDYSPYHDGAWWRRWWEANKASLPDSARQTPIPDLPRTASGKTYTPIPESFETLDGKIAWLREALRAGLDLAFNDIGEAMASHQDPRAIPVLIGLIEADDSERTIYGIGHFALGPLTKVKYDESHNGAWWRRWWNENRAGFSKEARDTPIPDLRADYAAWAAGLQAREQARIDAQFAGYPAQDLRASGDDRKRYFLMGPGEGRAMPADGWKLLLILPGGDGSADFHHFCRSIGNEALPDGYVAAELVAPAWSNDPNRTVWPTRVLNGDKAAFTTEDFIRAVVDDTASRVKIDRRHILALGWSSSGPALYCDSLQPDTPVTGWFIAMSVFRPQWMPDIGAAKGRAYYILHSPDETMIPIDAHARVALTRLTNAGAAATLTEYAGGHGWTEDPYGHIRRGVEWLEEHAPR